MSPFRSEAQRKKFRQLVAEGKMDPDTLDKWEAETPAGKLPDKLPTKARKPKGRPKKNAR